MSADVKRRRRAPTSSADVERGLISKVDRMVRQFSWNGGFLRTYTKHGNLCGKRKLSFLFLLLLWSGESGQRAIMCPTRSRSAPERPLTVLAETEPPDVS